MKIVITTVQIPFITGGAELLAENLRDAFIKAGHQAEIVTMPFMDLPMSRIEDHIVASRLLEVEDTWSGRTDLCVGLKFPAYYIRHHNKVLWILHQHRGAYDLFNNQTATMKDDPEGRKYRDMITRADDIYLSEAKRIYTIAKNVTGRLKKYNDINSVPLYHPCPNYNEFRAGEYGDYILMPSRINVTKRQSLALEAMQHVKSDIKLYIVGQAGTEYEKDELLNTIERKGLTGKVIYMDFVPDEEKIKLYADARAVLFIPYDEDYGYITQEAMRSHKAVITATDSGGPLEFVQNGKSGIVASPNPADIAKAIDELGYSEKAARKMGEAAFKRIREMNITWENVVKELTR